MAFRRPLLQPVPTDPVLVIFHITPSHSVEKSERFSSVQEIGPVKTQRTSIRLGRRCREGIIELGSDDFARFSDDPKCTDIAGRGNSPAPVIGCHYDLPDVARARILAYQPTPTLLGRRKSADNHGFGPLCRASVPDVDSEPSSSGEEPVEQASELSWLHVNTPLVDGRVTCRQESEVPTVEPRRSVPRIPSYTKVSRILESFRRADRATSAYTTLGEIELHVGDI